MAGLVIHDSTGNIQCSYTAIHYDLDQLARDNTPQGMSALKIHGHHDALVRPHRWSVKDGKLAAKPNAPAPSAALGNSAL